MHRANTLSALKYGTVSPESSRLTICIKRNGKVNRRGRVGWGEGLGEATAEMFKTTDLIQRLWYRAGICTKTDQDAGPEGLEKTDVNFYLLSNTPWFTESKLSDERICVLNFFLGLTPDTSLCRFKCLVLCVCVCVRRLANDLCYNKPPPGVEPQGVSVIAVHVWTGCWPEATCSIRSSRTNPSCSRAS